MISPQGYLLGKDPKSKNPFWNQGETNDVDRIFATATVDDNVGTPQVQTTKSISGNDITFGFNFKNLKGRPGEPGTPGSDGISPTASVRSVANGSEITITDKNGTTRSVVQNGTPGTPGVSPVANVIPTSNGARITITDANGTTEADIENGTPGQTGATPNVTATATVGNGSGTPSVDVTRSGSNESPVLNFAFDNLKGTPGQNGTSPTVAITDITGGHRVTVTDANGSRYFDVMDGTNGVDGVSPTARVEQIQGQNAAKIVVTDAQGTTEATLTGEAGTPGFSPTVAITDITGGHRVTVTDAQGSRSFDVMDGTPGTPGTKGDDGISPTASVQQTSSGATITITDANGTTTANLTNGSPGTPGQNGITPVISATATVDGTSGTPSVNVTKSGTDAAPSFAFAFSGLKGESGQGGGGLRVIVGVFNQSQNVRTVALGDSQWGSPWQIFPNGYYTWNDGLTSDSEIYELIRTGKIIRAYYTGPSNISGVSTPICTPLEASTFTRTVATSVSEQPFLAIRGDNQYTMAVGSRIILYVQE